MHVFSQESERSCSSGLELFQQCGICLFGFFFYYRYTEYASEVIYVSTTDISGSWTELHIFMLAVNINTMHKSRSWRGVLDANFVRN
jgi:hypothetical protein